MTDTTKEVTKLDGDDMEGRARRSKEVIAELNLTFDGEELYKILSCDSPTQTPEYKKMLYELVRVIEGHYINPCDEDEHATSENVVYSTTHDLENFPGINKLTYVKIYPELCGWMRKMAEKYGKEYTEKNWDGETTPTNETILMELICDGIHSMPIYGWTRRVSRKEDKLNYTKILRSVELRAENIEDWNYNTARTFFLGIVKSRPSEAPEDMWHEVALNLYEWHCLEKGWRFHHLMELYDTSYYDKDILLNHDCIEEYARVYSARYQTKGEEWFWKIYNALTRESLTSDNLYIGSGRMGYRDVYFTPEHSPIRLILNIKKLTDNELKWSKKTHDKIIHEIKSYESALFLWEWSDIDSQGIYKVVCDVYGQNS